MVTWEELANKVASEIVSIEESLALGRKLLAEETKSTSAEALSNIIASLEERLANTRKYEQKYREEAGKQ